MTHAAGATAGVGGPGALADGYDTCLLDLDGVVYLGSGAVPAAAEAIAELRRGGTRPVFVTNNASRTPHAIAAHLRRLGVPAEADDVATSAQAAAGVIAENVAPGSKVLVVGGTGLRQAVRDLGFAPVTTAAERPAAVAQGYAPLLGVDLIAEGALAVRGGAFYVASNADATLPTDKGQVPGNGALSEVIRVATGRRPVVAGKPERPMYREAARRAGGRRPLVVGDRLETDIAGAVHAGIDSMLVLTGVAGPLDVVLAPPPRRPTHLGRDLSALTAPQPGVVRYADGAWYCGGWQARWREDHIDLTGRGDPVDGLRALCAAAWAVHHGPLDPAAVRDAAAGLAERLRGR